MFWRTKNTRVVTLRDVMTRKPVTIKPNHHLSTAKKLMGKHSVRHLPVIDDGDLFGVISDRDVNLASSIYEGSRADSILIRDVCLFTPYTASESTTLMKVLTEMLDRKYGCVLATKRKQLTGIFTMIDAGKLLQEMLL